MKAATPNNNGQRVASANNDPATSRVRFQVGPGQTGFWRVQWIGLMDASPELSEAVLNWGRIVFVTTSDLYGGAATCTLELIISSRKPIARTFSDVNCDIK